MPPVLFRQEASIVRLGILVRLGINSVGVDVGAELEAEAGKPAVIEPATALQQFESKPLKSGVRACISDQRPKTRDSFTPGPSVITWFGRDDSSPISYERSVITRPGADVSKSAPIAGQKDR